MTLEIQDTTEEQILSSGAVYHFAFDSSVDSSGEENHTNEHDDGSGFDMVVVQRIFKWLDDDQCKSSFVCGKLDGNSCGDFSVDVQDSSDKPMQICMTGEVYQGHVDQGGEFLIDLWYSEGSVFNVSCYLWCTQDGHVPKTNENSTITESTRKELVIEPMIAKLPDNFFSVGLQVNSTNQLRSFSLQEEDSFSVISPLNVYSMITPDVSTCDADLCIVNAQLLFVAEPSCKFTFACPSMPETPCGTYGVELSYPGIVEDQKICHTGGKITGTHSRNENVTISLWYTNYTEKIPECYYWCTEDGSLYKRAPSEVQLTDHDIQTFVSIVLGCMNVNQIISFR